MGAVGLVLFVLGIFFFTMFHSPFERDGWAANLSFAAYVIGFLLMLASATAWLWRVMP